MTTVMIVIMAVMVWHCDHFDHLIELDMSDSDGNAYKHRSSLTSFCQEISGVDHNDGI